MTIKPISKNTIYIGIDPGKTGYISYITSDWVQCVPLKKTFIIKDKTNKNFIDFYIPPDILKLSKYDVVVTFEDIGNFYLGSKKGCFSFGRNFEKAVFLVDYLYRQVFTKSNENRSVNFIKAVDWQKCYNFKLLKFKEFTTKDKALYTIKDILSKNDLPIYVNDFINKTKYIDGMGDSFLIALSPLVIHTNT